MIIKLIEFMLCRILLWFLNDYCMYKFILDKEFGGMLVYFIVVILKLMLFLRYFVYVGMFSFWEDIFIMLL